MAKLLPTTRAQVSGHQFMRRRMEHGLIFGDIRMIHDPLARRRKAMMFGGGGGFGKLDGRGRPLRHWPGDARGPVITQGLRGAQRGRRVELIERTVEGTEDVVERVRDAGGDVDAIDADAVTLDGGERVPSAVTVWTAGAAASPLVRASGLPADDGGYLRVDATLRAVICPPAILTNLPSSTPWRPTARSEEAFGLIDDPHPIVSFLPIMLVGIVFGLAMDYQVFLVTRMREAYVHGADAKTAVVEGYRHSARVVAASA